MTWDLTDDTWWQLGHPWFWSCGYIGKVVASTSRTFFDQTRFFCHDDANDHSNVLLKDPDVTTSTVFSPMCSFSNIFTSEEHRNVSE